MAYGQNACSFDALSICNYKYLSITGGDKDKDEADEEMQVDGSEDGQRMSGTDGEIFYLLYR